MRQVKYHKQQPGEREERVIPVVVGSPVEVIVEVTIKKRSVERYAHF